MIKVFKNLFLNGKPRSYRVEIVADGVAAVKAESDEVDDGQRRVARVDPVLQPEIKIFN
jgi:hypothetical protein